MPIKSIRHKGLWLLYEEDDARGVAASSADKLRDMLTALGTVQTIEDVGAVPGWELSALKGELAGCWTLTVTRDCWLIFRFEDGSVLELDLVDTS